jgi:hypothetical protein
VNYPTDWQEPADRTPEERARRAGWLRRVRDRAAEDRLLREVVGTLARALEECEAAIRTLRKPSRDQTS